MSEKARPYELRECGWDVRKVQLTWGTLTTSHTIIHGRALADRGH